MPRTLAATRIRQTLPLRKIIAALAGWRRRQRSRAHLARLEHWQLSDVGLTPRQARNEAARWF